MPRLVSTLFLVALLAGTAAAFAVTQGLKLERSPILSPRVDRVFSPVCDCLTRVATIRFRLRKPDRVRVEIVRGDEVVRELVEGRRLRRGTVTYTWNGRDDHGRFVPEGVYRPRVHLDDQRRTIVLPNEMRVDTTAPRVLSVEPSDVVMTAGKRLVIRYRLSERAHGVLSVRGRREIFTRAQKQNDALAWKAPRNPGFYELFVAGQDAAGNLGDGEVVRVAAYYVDIRRNIIRQRPGARFEPPIASPGSYSWIFAGRRGTHTGTAPLLLTAPTRPGRYPLVVSADGHTDRATVIVRRR